MKQITKRFGRSENTKTPVRFLPLCFTTSRVTVAGVLFPILWAQSRLVQPSHSARTARRTERNSRNFWPGSMEKSRPQRGGKANAWTIGGQSFSTVTTPARGKSLLLGLPSRGDAHGSVTRLEPVFPGSASQIKLMEGNRGATDQPFALSQQAENRTILRESNGLPYCERTGYTGQPVSGLPVVGKARWQAGRVNTPRN